MNLVRPVVLAAVALSGAAFALAQDATSTPPKILQITREWIKPGKAGMAHDRSEAAFVSLMNKAKLQGHYVALNSMSGKSRALYIARYPSFEAWEKDNRIVEHNTALTAEFDRAAMTDGELLDGMDQAILTYDEELSYHPNPDLTHARYYEITVFRVRLGHRKEWYEVSKMYRDACEKGGMKTHWGMYELAYGGDSNTFIAFTHRDSLTEVDASFAEGKKFVEAVGGKEALDKLDALYGQAVESARSELFSINPKQSYPEEVWVQANPDFWKPKMMKGAEAGTSKPGTPATPAKPSSR